MSSPKDQIIMLPNKQLHELSRKVKVVDNKIKSVISAMESAVIDWEASRPHEVGVALAAIQLGMPYRIIVIRNNFDDKEDKTFSVFINPTITKLEGTVEDDYEGCLSITDIYGKVPRFNKIRIKALDINGKEFRFTAEGFLARVLQHEVDHTYGLTFIDRIKNSKTSFYKLTPEGKLEQLNYDKDIKPYYILR